MEQRDFVGYGKTPPRIEWPDGAQIAVSIVINYEEGSERTPLLGDAVHETAAELASVRPPEARDFQTESQWEYGGRAGIWRVMRILDEHAVKATFNVSALALEHNPPLGPEIVAAGHDITGHGYRWIEQWHLDRDAETEYIRKAVLLVMPGAWMEVRIRVTAPNPLTPSPTFVYQSSFRPDFGSGLCPLVRFCRGFEPCEDART